MIAKNNSLSTKLYL